MKRTVFLVVALFALMAVGLYAQTEADFEVWVSKDGKSISITGYKGSATTVNIPAKIKNLPVVEVDDDSFKKNSNITSVTIPSGVTRIGDNAFVLCVSLSSITIPNGVTEIGKQAFSDCDHLTSITIPGSVTKIGSSAFSGCVQLASVTFAGSIPSSGFPANAFSGQGDIRDKYLAAGGGAGTYTRPRAGTTWTKGASANATPAPAGTAGLEYVLINNNKEYSVAKGTVTTGAVVIPAAYNNLPVTALAVKAFTSSGITGITIPVGVTSIGEWAFNGCSSLASVTLPNSVTNIGNDAFSGCPKLTGITIPNSVKSIGNAVFYGSTGLASIIIPNSVTSVHTPLLSIAL